MGIHLNYIYLFNGTAERVQLKQKYISVFYVFRMRSYHTTEHALHI